ncbi:MAG: universal stress protein [Coriobacteriia bacterium]|nr:universal stress protein [Coriobacteriia bacterium]
MFSNAIVATDLGPASEGIVACAGALKALGVREAILVYAIDLETEPSADQDVAFQQQLDSLEAVGVRVHVETPLGYAPHAITQLALEHNAGIIVMGTRGQGLFHTGFSGSVSSDVVRLSTVPVLLVPAATGASAESGGAVCARLLSSILVPVDLASGAERVCELACGLVRTGAPRVEILHAIEMSFEAVRDNREARARAMLDDFAATARASGAAEVITTIVRGRPDEEVARLAATGRYSLVVLAPGCHDTIDQAFGSVTSSVIRGSLTPVLLAPPTCDTTFYARGKT